MRHLVSSDASWLKGRRVLALVQGYGLIDEIIAGAAELGAAVSLPEIDASSRESMAAALDDAVHKDGVPELVLLSVVPDRAMRVESIAAMPPADWHAIVLDGLRATLWLLQTLGAHMKPAGGAIVFIAPSFSLVGAPGLVGLSTLLEGQRGLMKSVARQWGATGITLNWISVAPRVLAPFEGASLATKPDAVSVALGRAPDPRTEIPPLLGFLGSPGGRVMTGATLMMDGGEWMVP